MVMILSPYEIAMNIIEFRRIQGVAKIIRLIESDYEEICLVALNCLLKLARDGNFCTYLTKDQILIELKNLKFLPIIVNVFVRSTNNSILQITIQTLAAILKNPDILSEFPHYFPHNTLIEVFQNDYLKKDALILLAVAAEHSNT
jgi:hypothetical protein